MMLLAEAEAAVVQERAIVDALRAHADEHERLLIKAEGRVTLYRGFLDEPTQATASSVVRAAARP